MNKDKQIQDLKNRIEIYKTKYWRSGGIIFNLKTCIKLRDKKIKELEEKLEVRK